MKKKSEIAILYISKYFRKNISLKELANISGISPFHFHRKFVEENNRTPHGYLEDIRMQNATHVMKLFPNWSLTNVAFDCGYSSPGIFSRAFKKYFGSSPSKYKLDNHSEDMSVSSIDTAPIKIQYLAKKTITVQKVILSEIELNNAYQKLIDTTNSTINIYGFYVDAPFHIPAAQCRYFFGLESNNSELDSSVLSIAPGYYTTVILEGEFENLKEKIYILNNQIQNMGFVIDSLIGIEKISTSKKTAPFSYMESKRELYVKIKRE